MTHDPFAGEVDYLPGTLFATCPVDGTTAVLAVVVLPDKFRFRCPSCKRRWHVEHRPHGWLWIDMKEEPDAHAPAS